ncbi:MAG: N-acetyl sugar amidotransferase, partial [Gemmatimonadales bacterium]
MMEKGSKARTHQVCVRCVMDTTDPDIRFDEAGVCNHCHAYDIQAKKLDFPPEEMAKKLEAIVKRI